MLILPPNYLETNLPVIFLAGPIQGARDWQAEAIQYIQAQSTEVAIASPRKKRLGETTFIYAEQVDWESHYLNRAAQNGTVLFYLAKEETHHPKRAYAQTTRFELAEWKTKQLYMDCNIIIGIEEGFSGARYIRHRIAQDNPKIEIVDNLKTTCDLALRLALSQ